MSIFRHSRLFTIAVLVMMIAMAVIIFEHDLQHGSDSLITKRFCLLCSALSGFSIYSVWQFSLFLLNLLACIGILRLTVACRVTERFRRTVSPRPPPVPLGSMPSIP